MKFDFDTFVERGGKDSLAADMVPFPVKPDEGVKKIPMWIADMSFPTAPAVIRASHRHHRNAHEKRVAGCPAARIRERVESDIHIRILAEIIERKSTRFHALLRYPHPFQPRQRIGTVVRLIENLSLYEQPRPRYIFMF